MRLVHTLEEAERALVEAGRCACGCGRELSSGRQIVALPSCRVRRYRQRGRRGPMTPEQKRARALRAEAADERETAARLRRQAEELRAAAARHETRARLLEAEASGQLSLLELLVETPRQASAQVPCPSCGAAAGEPCRSLRGNPLSRVHAPRRAA